MRFSTAGSLLMVAFLAVLSGCSSLNPFATKPPKPAEPPAFEATAEIRPLWQVNVGSDGGYHFQPVVVNGAVYAAGQSGTVARILDGRTVWSTDLGVPLSAGVGSDGRSVAVVTTRGEVIALDAATGAERWRKPAGVEVLAPPGVAEGTIAVRASDSRLLGFDADSGERRWVYQRSIPSLTLRSAAGMHVDGGAALIGFPGGKLVAIKLDNGGPLWELTVATPRGVTELERVTDIAGTPVLVGSQVCAVAYQGRAACFELNNGSTIWSREFSSSVGLDRDGSLVFITDAADSVHALNATSGASVWKQEPMFLRRLSRPLAVGDGVVVGDFEGYIHALDRAKGHFVARTRADGGAIVAAPRRLGDGRFVVQTRSGSVQAFELK